MALVTRAGKGSKLNSVEMDDNLLYLATTLSASGAGGIISVTGSTIQAPNTSITASYFRGDGRALTNVTASSIAAGNVAAAGSNTYIQYNNNGILGAEAAFTYNASTNTLTTTNIVAGDLQIGKAIDTGNGYLLDGADITSIDWKNRTLNWADGASFFDWNTQDVIKITNINDASGVADKVLMLKSSTGVLYITGSSAFATPTSSLLVTASATNNIITFTKGNGSTFAVTVGTGSGGGAFPFSGNAIITGSLFIAQSGSNHLGIPGMGIISNQGNIYVYDNPALTQYRTIRVEDAGGYGSTIMSLDQLSINNLYGNLELLLSGSYTNAGYENRTMLKHTSTIGANLYVTSNTKIILSGSSGVDVSGSLSLKDLLVLSPRTTTPSGAPTGSIIASGSAGNVKPYFFDGTNWNALY